MLFGTFRSLFGTTLKSTNARNHLIQQRRWCGKYRDASFEANSEGLSRAVAQLMDPPEGLTNPMSSLPADLPCQGLGERVALEALAPIILGGARRLGTWSSFDHMDPPTPWITWATTMWNASLNQNLLHPDLAPVARQLEKRVVDWLIPYFGMDGGHMVPGSSIANLTALWAARDLKKVKIVLSSGSAHLSVPKSAHLLGLEHFTVPTLPDGRIDSKYLPEDLSSSALVLTAGTTSCGAIDDLELLRSGAAWNHVDAAWAGPLRLSRRYANCLAGITGADSIAISAHKWLFQPKGSALVFFRDNATAEKAISFRGSYLAIPNVGVQGSHGAVAAPLLATLLAWGEEGMAARINRTMAVAEDLHQRLEAHPLVEVFGPMTCGVILWRPRFVSNLQKFRSLMPEGISSLTSVEGQEWLRNVAANPMVDITRVWNVIEQALAANQQSPQH